MARLIHIRSIREDEEAFIYEFYDPTLHGGKERRGEVRITKDCGKVTIIAMEDMKWLNTGYTGRVLFKLVDGFKKGELKPIMDWRS